MINIGSNKFDKVAFPLVFENRYFMIEPTKENDVWTVITLQDGKPIIEILRNKPQENSISEVVTNSTGIITVSNPETGKFLYKLRPGSKNSSIFGTINGEEKEIKITDKEICVGTNIFQNNLVIGFAVGIMVNRNGGISMGGGLPPELQQILNT